MTDALLNGKAAVLEFYSLWLQVALVEMLARYSAFPELSAGLVILRKDDHNIAFSIAIHDHTYSVDFAIHQICFDQDPTAEKH